jgi:hypothetical protein
MYIQCKGSPNRNAWYHDKKGWIFEVYDETVSNLNRYRCAPRYVLTQASIIRLREIFGISAINHAEYIPVDEAKIIAVEPDEVDENNISAALFNVAEQHGYELLSVDWRKKAKKEE